MSIADEPRPSADSLGRSTLARLRARQSGEAQAAESTGILAALPGLTDEDLAEAEKRAGKKVGFVSGLLPDSPGQAIPGVRHGVRYAKARGYTEALARIEGGEGTREDSLKVLDRIVEQGRERTFMGGTGEMVQEFAGTMAEIALPGAVIGKAVAALPAVGLRAGLTGGGAAIRALGSRGARTLLTLGVGAPAMREVLPRLTGHGGGAISLSSLERAMPGVQMTVDQQGRLAAYLESSFQDFIEAPVPQWKGLVDEYVEMAAEATGGVMMKLPLLRQLQGAQIALARKLIADRGGDVEKFLADAAARGFFSGPIGEMLENRVATAGKAAVPGMEETLGDVFPGADEIAQELLAGAIVGGGAAAVGGAAVAGKARQRAQAKSEVDAALGDEQAVEDPLTSEGGDPSSVGPGAAPEVQGPTTYKPLGRAEREADVEAYRSALAASAPEGAEVAAPEIAEPRTRGELALQAILRRRGIDPTFVKGAAANAPAFFPGEGRAVVGLGADAYDAGIHEAFHTRWAQMDEDGRAGLEAELEGIDPGFLGRVRDWRAENARIETPELAREEALTTGAQVLGTMGRYLRTEQGAADFAKVFEENVGKLRRVGEAIVDTLGTLIRGLPITQRAAARNRLAVLETAFNAPGRAAVLARALNEAFDGIAPVFDAPPVAGEGAAAPGPMRIPAPEMADAPGGTDAARRRYGMPGALVQPPRVGTPEQQSQFDTLVARGRYGMPGMLTRADFRRPEETARAADEVRWVDERGPDAGAAPTAGPQGPRPAGTRTDPRRPRATFTGRRGDSARVAETRPPEAATRAAVRGDEVELELPDGRTLPAQYVAVEADALIPSHDARQRFRRNEGGDANERPYDDPTEGRASRETVERIARKPKPRLIYTDTPTAIDGPPVVRPGGVVLGGNARTMGLQLAYSEGGAAAAAYRAAAIDFAARAGLDRAAVEAMAQPVIVREILSDQAGKRGEISRVLNQSLTTARSALTDAVSRGQKIDAAAAEEIVAAIGSGTLSDAWSSPDAVRGLLRALVKAGAFDQADVTRLVTPQGLLTPTGKDTVEQALLGAVIPDVRVLAETAPALRNKLLRGLPGSVRASGAWAPLRTHLVHAVEALNAARQSGLSATEVFAQQTIVAEPWQQDALAADIARSLDDSGPLEWARRMRILAADLREQQSGQTGMFAGVVAATPEAAVQRAMEDPPVDGLRFAPSLRGMLGAIPAIDRARVSAAVDWLRLRLQDDTVPIREYPEFRTAVKRSRTIGAARLERFAEAVDALIAPLRTSPATLRDAQRAMYLMAAQERNAWMLAERGALDGSGIPSADAAKELAAIRARVGPQIIDDFLAGIARLNKERLDHLVETRMVDAPRAAEWHKREPHWVSMRDVDVTADEHLGFSTSGRSVQVKNPQIRKAEGRETEAEDTLIAWFSETVTRMRAAEKNRAMHVGADLARKGVPGLRVIPKPTGVPGGFTAPADHVAFVDGAQQMYLVMASEDAAAALKGLNGEQTGFILNAIGKLTRMFSRSVTGRNPFFWMPNFLRDTTQAFWTIGAERDIRQGAKVLGRAWATLPGMIRYQLTGDTRAVSEIEAAKRAGFKVTWLGRQTMQELLDDFRTKIEGPTKIRDKVQATLRLLERVGDSFEMATRYAAFTHELEKLTAAGVPRAEAELRAGDFARELTLNFDTRGTWTPALSSLYAFFNPSVQGSARLIKAATSGPRGYAAVGAVFVLGAVMEALGYALADDDPETGLNEYGSVPEWEKSRNIVLPFKIAGAFPKVTLPYGLDAIFGGGRRSIHFAADGGIDPRQTRGKAIQETLLQAGVSFNPIGDFNDPIAMVTPTVGRPFVEIERNEKFGGRPIMKPKDSFGQTLPDSARAFSTIDDRATGWLAQRIANVLNLGGPETLPTGLDVSPESVQHLLEFFTAGFGLREADRVSEFALSNRPVRLATNVPILRNFASAVTDHHVSELYYNVRNMSSTLHGLAKQAESGEELAAIRARDPRAWALRERINKIDRRLSDMGRALRSGDLTPAEEREVRTRMTSWQSRVVRAYYEKP